MKITKNILINYFIELLNNLETKTSPQYPDFIFYIYKDKLYIDYNKKDNIAWVNRDKIWSNFEYYYSDNYIEIRNLASELMEEHLKLKGVITNSINFNNVKEVEEHLKLKGVTINKT